MQHILSVNKKKSIFNFEWMLICLQEHEFLYDINIIFKTNYQTILEEMRNTMKIKIKGFFCKCLFLM